MDQKGFCYFSIRMVFRSVKDANLEIDGAPICCGVKLPKMIPHRGVMSFIQCIPDVLIKSQAYRTLSLADVLKFLTVLLADVTAQLVNYILLRAVA